MKNKYRCLRVAYSEYSPLTIFNNYMSRKLFSTLFAVHRQRVYSFSTKLAAIAAVKYKNERFPLVCEKSRSINSR